MSQAVGDEVGGVAARRGPNGVVRFAQRWSLFAVLVLVWQWLTGLMGNPYFPTPLAIVREAGRLWFSGPTTHLGLTGSVFDDILPGLARAAIGWGIAVVLGVAAGLVVGRLPVVADSCRALLAFVRTVPPAALVAVFLVLFHVGPVAEVATIVFGCVWPVLVNTADGARSVDPTSVDVARVYRVPWYVRLFGVIVPAAGPKIFAGLRTSLPIAFVLMIIAELVGSTSGIGYRLVFAQGSSDLPGTWAWIVLVGALGYLSTSLLVLLERRVLRWHRDANGQEA
ncbi:MAG TPA: ABC transporter permease [Pseudonocardiaceae bacterium]|jgi:ABC-type nitrate/sulfonate/bicarbonate transport system permease component|nr:ABC transporter permease [Pseudonocardiaceae bacterium]